MNNENKKQHKFYSVRFSFLLVASIILLASFFSFFYKNRIEDTSKAVSAEKILLPAVILDAGHGGMDSGAVSVYGDEEKFFNLAVTKKLGAFLENAGIRVIYTRTEDEMVECKEKNGSRKTRDLLGRVQCAQSNPDALFVSIHMNTLPIEKYKGLQIFYTDRNDANRALAQVMQNNVRTMLQTDNNRNAKDAEGKIFILDRISQPAILIECGFLSNKEEAALLKDEVYQNKLAYVLSRSIIDFMSEK